MVNDKYKIIWSKRSLQHLRKAYEYISKDSLKNAAKVVNDISRSWKKQNAIRNIILQINIKSTIMVVTGLFK